MSEGAIRKAAGGKDGIALSRWRRHGDAPFGQPFKYTDPQALHPGATNPYYNNSGTWLSTLKRWLRRRRRPVGWIVLDPDQEPVAFIVGGPESEMRVSAIETRFLEPIYDERIIELAAAYKGRVPKGV